MKTLAEIKAKLDTGWRPTTPEEKRSFSQLVMRLKPAVMGALAKRVDDETRAERVAICATCDHLRSDGDQQFCGVCKCNISAASGRVFNLAAVEEKRGKAGQIVRGCKHPERAQGKGWRR